MALDVHRHGIMRKGTELQYDIEMDKIMHTIVTKEHPIDPLKLLGEKSFEEPREIPESEIGTPIQEFFRGATVLITGGTGFMGKILLDKLLRSCPHLKKIYLLVRVKKGKTAMQRVDEIFNDRVFKRLKYEVPKYCEKVRAINGDISSENLGLSAEDRATLVAEVSVIFHGAATVRFDERIDNAININLLGTKRMVELAKQLKNLKVMMYTSTAYANCPYKVLEEKFYDPNAHYKEVIKKVEACSDEKELATITPKLLGKWPNSYTYTKSLAESMVREEASELPIGIFRPSVVISTYREPVRGWTDNVYGPLGLIVGICTGIIHVYYPSLDIVTDMVPVDLAVNSLISTAVATADDFKKPEKSEREIPIYQYASGVQNPITWRQLISLSEKHGHHWPTIRAIWYYSFVIVNTKFGLTLLSFLLQTLPGYILDGLAILTGRKPMLSRIYRKMDAVRSTLDYFTQEWTFKNDRTQSVWNKLDQKDKSLFFFDMGTVSWDYFYEAMYIGLRVYLVNDDINTLPAARKKWQRLYVAHCLLRATFWTVVFYFTWMFLDMIKNFFTA